MKLLLFIAITALATSAMADDTNRVPIGGVAVLYAHPAGVLQCLDPNNNDFPLFQVDPSDPSFEVPGLLWVGGYLNVGGPAVLNSTVALHLTRPTNSVYSSAFSDAVILVPAGTNREITLNGGFDARQVIIKDSGTASGTNIVVRDIHDDRFDGAAVLTLTNDFESANLIYDGDALRWWRIK